jgi:hypothetical protein
MTLGGAGGIFMRYETAPSKDEALFSVMTPVFWVVAATAPDIRKILEAQNPAVPVCRWVRWRLQASAPTSNWGATFRIHCAANRGGLR